MGSLPGCKCSSPRLCCKGLCTHFPGHYTKKLKDSELEFHACYVIDQQHVPLVPAETVLGSMDEALVWADAAPASNASATIALASMFTGIVSHVLEVARRDFEDVQLMLWASDTESCGALGVEEEGSFREIRWVRRCLGRFLGWQPTSSSLSRVAGVAHGPGDTRARPDGAWRGMLAGVGRRDERAPTALIWPCDARQRHTRRHRCVWPARHLSVSACCARCHSTYASHSFAMHRNKTQCVSRPLVYHR
jgi:hypothetical protein